MKGHWRMGIAITSSIVIAGVALLGLWVLSRSRSNSAEPINRWFSDPAARPALLTAQAGRACPDAPFILPSDGLIGLLYSDPIAPYTLLNPHPGVDIFGDGAPGEVPIYAVYDGWLTREADWLSSVIIRHADPLQAGRTIWSYYTHMASEDGSISYIVADFPPDTHELPIKQGTLLGYQGLYAGVGRPPIGLHLHFSLVLSAADGSYTNEARLANTLDPSPYFGLSVNSADLPPRPITCDIGE